MDTAATIIAISSPPGSAVHGLLRLSGDAAMEAVNNCLESKIASKWRGTCHSRFIIDPALHSTLPVLVMSFPSPHSYTGEDVVEIKCPGNPDLLERMINRIIAGGAHSSDSKNNLRHAEPGEFTARAYWHGRLTLNQAEGVAAAIAARSDEQLETARLLLSQAFGNWARQSGDEITQLLALVEAGIDFTDQEDVVAIKPADLYERIVDIQKQWQQWLGQYSVNEHHEALPWVVLTGAPNVGKSTLFNALLGRTRAVSSPIAGTTRDVLAETLVLSGPTGPLSCILVDVAGWDKRTGQLDAEMQIAATTAVDRAAVQIACSTGDVQMTQSPGVINVLTKCDQADVNQPLRRDKHALMVSAITGTGLAALNVAIAEAITNLSVSPTRTAPGLMAKHRQALADASKGLTEAASMALMSAQQRQLDHAELVAAALGDALTAMQPLIGQVPPDDVLDHVFASFCVGK